MSVRNAQRVMWQGEGYAYPFNTPQFIYKNLSKGLTSPDVL